MGNNAFPQVSMSASNVYSRDDAIAEFFAQTCTTRYSCETRAPELVGGRATPVEVQGVCSYSRMSKVLRHSLFFTKISHIKCILQLLIN